MRARALQGFDDATLGRLLDRQPFVFNHALVDHPALSLENLAEVIPQLPAEQVFHSNGRLSLADNLDRAHREHRPEQALQEALQHASAAQTLWVIGGAQIYAEALPLAERIELTEIARDFEGDAYAPALDAGWQEVARSAHTSTNGLPYSFVTLERPKD